MNKFLKPMADLTTDNLEGIINTINGVVSAGLGILTAGTVILAIFIAFKFFTADDDTKRKNAKSQLIYCIIGVIVLIALLILAPTVTNLIGQSLGGEAA